MFVKFELKRSFPHVCVSCCISDRPITNLFSGAFIRPHFLWTSSNQYFRRNRLKISRTTIDVQKESLIQTDRSWTVGPTVWTIMTTFKISWILFRTFMVNLPKSLSRPGLSIIASNFYSRSTYLGAHLVLANCFDPATKHARNGQCCIS